MVYAQCQASFIRDLFIHHYLKLLAACRFGVEARRVLRPESLREFCMLSDAERYQSIIDEEEYMHTMHCMYGFKQVPYQAFCEIFHWQRNALAT